MRYIEFFFFFSFLARADERAQQALCFNGHTNLIVLPRPRDTHNETPIERERKRERELCSDAKRTSGAYVFDKLLLKPARQRDDRKKPSLVEYIGEDRGGGDRVEMYANERWIDRAAMKMGFVRSNERKEGGGGERRGGEKSVDNSI